MSPHATLVALSHAASGSAGTAVSTAALFPLDLATTRLKAQRVVRGPARYRGVADALRVIRAREGAAALYRGLGPDVAKSVIDSFLFFGFYSYLRGRDRRPGVAKELASGALAGAAARALTTPIAAVVTRMQMAERPESLRRTLAAVLGDGGVAALWSGYSATVLLTLNPSIAFFVNRRLARRILPALEEEDIPVAWVAFLLAALSKATATALTYPFQTARLRLQMSGEQAKDASPDGQDGDEGAEARAASLLVLLRRMLDKTVIGVLFQVIRKEGRRALYDGLQGELVKGFLSHGLTMLMKGLFYRLAVRLWFILRPRLRRRLQAK